MTLENCNILVNVFNKGYYAYKCSSLLWYNILVNKICKSLSSSPTLHHDQIYIDLPVHKKRKEEKKRNHWVEFSLWCFMVEPWSYLQSLNSERTVIQTVPYRVLAQDSGCGFGWRGRTVSTTSEDTAWLTISGWARPFQWVSGLT